MISIDSKAALCNLKFMSARIPNVTLVYIILQTLTFATTLNYPTVFRWVPGHCDIKENLFTDHVPSLSYKNDVLDLIPLFKSDVGYLLRNISRAMCRDLWFDTLDTESCLYSIDPNLDFTTDASLPRAHKISLCRLRLEVAYTKHFLYSEWRHSD